ncbi:MAG: hypothetical protein NVSMB9_11410 [Isosphaeraceae bacterium]
MVGTVRVDRAVLVGGKEHGAFEAVVSGEDLRELRQGFLGSVFLIAADQHHMLSLARTGLSLDNDPGVVGAGAGQEEEGEDEKGRG